MLIIALNQSLNEPLTQCTRRSNFPRFVYPNGGRPPFRLFHFYNGSTRGCLSNDLMAQEGRDSGCITKSSRERKQVFCPPV